jgi:hypothetical protein
MAKLTAEEIVEGNGIIADIKAHIKKCGGSYSDWYVGITGNRDQRLFVEHNVKKKGGAWISCKASSSDIARAVEKYFIKNHETQGGSDVGDDDSVYVYSYKVTDYTVEYLRILVRGGKNTSDLECKVCESWLNHWKKLSGVNKNVYCCHPEHKKTKKKLADRGAHVKKIDTPEDQPKRDLSQIDISDIKSGKLFIIPVCEEHNITEKENILIPKILLVDAKPCKEETFGDDSDSDDSDLFDKMLEDLFNNE